MILIEMDKQQYMLLLMLASFLIVVVFILLSYARSVATRYGLWLADAQLPIVLCCPIRYGQRQSMMNNGDEEYVTFKNVSKQLKFIWSFIFMTWLCVDYMEQRCHWEQKTIVLNCNVVIERNIRHWSEFLTEGVCEIGYGACNNIWWQIWRGR